MSLAVARTSFALAASLLVLSACTLASPTYITAKEGDSSSDDEDSKEKKLSGENTGDDSSSDAAGASSCKLAKPDMSKLTACESGKGHCYAKDKVPNYGPLLIACAKAGEVCVPDEILEAGGGKLKTCKSYGGIDGACVTSSLIPEIAKQGGSVLPKDVCDADQQCLPCTDPITKKDTGFCKAIGVSDASCTGGAADPGTGGSSTAPAAATPCCVTNGRAGGVCIAATLVPEEQRDDTKRDVCGAQDKCVPKSLAEGKPVKCSAGFLGSGVCLDKCFNSMMAAASSFGVLSQDRCLNTEVCIPCLFAKDKGMPGCE